MHRETLRKMGNFKPSGRESVFRNSVKVSRLGKIWVKNGCWGILTQTTAGFIWVNLEGYSIKIAAFTTFTL